MNTTGQPDSQESRNCTSDAAGACVDTLDVVLLILTILMLTGVAAGIAIGFPQALEIIAVQAHAAVTVASDGQSPQEEDQSADENHEETEPFCADDIRSAAAVYAAGADTWAGSTPAVSAAT